MGLKNCKFYGLIGLFLFIAPFGVRAAGSLDIRYDEAAFTAPATLSITTTDATSSLPWEWASLSPAFEYSFITTGLYDPSHPLTLKINYTDTNGFRKQVYAYDSLSRTWRPLQTKDFPADKYVTAETDSTSGRIILLYNQDFMTVGTASWYKYKNGLFAASPDFAKGTLLRVYNTANGKSVDVTVNDWGPDRSKHPDRVIDLDKVAFSKIASTSAGLIHVRVEPVRVITPPAKIVLPQATDELKLTASSAVIMSEKTGQILWGKNESKVAPLASLTKLVAAKVYLDTKPNLKKVVTYKKADADYNKKYCAIGDSAQLKVKDGETMKAEDLLYSALVGSANNAVESLVRISGLKRDKFIARMNTLVKSWGATSTHFVEPTGLSPDNVSSPLDYAIITKAAFTNPLLKTISTTLRYSFKTVNTKQTHTISNTDELLRANYFPIIGSKTGYLDEAGYCLMTRVSAPEGNLISVNFGSTSKANNFLDNEQLVRYGLRLLKK